MPVFFDVSSLNVRIGDTAILQNLNLGFVEGEVTALLGHNGSGKSTLLKVLARQLAPSSGEVQLLGKSFRSTGAREFARSVGYLPQHPPGTDGLTVRELVALGRYPWRGPLGRYNEEDHRLITRAIEDTGLGQFQHRSVDTLSGGERQRVLLAQGLIPTPQLLVLDEPMSALDEAGIQVFERLLQHWRAAGVTVLWIEHDLAAVGRMADRVSGLNRQILFSSTPREALTPERLLALFSTHPRSTDHSQQGQPA